MDQQNSFVKFMVGDFRRHLNVPKSVLEDFQGQISKTVALRVSGGKTWNVGLAKRGEDLLAFQTGWKKFVQENGIEESDFLVFSYDGESCFDALIFDEEGCEKTSPFDLQSTNPRPNKKTNNAATMSNASPQRQVAERLSSSSSGDDLQSEEKRSPGKSKGTCEMHHVKEEEPAEMDDRLRLATSVYVSKKTPLKLEEEQKALELLLRIPKEHPIFTAVIQKSNLMENHSFLTIPFKFWAAHLPNRISKAVLEVPTSQKRWIARLTKRAIKGIGWCNFVDDNKLKKGDICVFELLENDIIARIRIHIAKS